MVCKAVHIAHLDFEAVASVASVASVVTVVHSGARGPVTGRGVKRDRWRRRGRTTSALSPSHDALAQRSTVVRGQEQNQQ